MEKEKVMKEEAKNNVVDYGAKVNERIEKENELKDDIIKSLSDNKIKASAICEKVREYKKSQKETSLILGVLKKL